MPDDRLVQALRHVERAGVQLDDQALRLVAGHYRQLDISGLLELLDTVAAIENRARRMSYGQALLDEFARLSSAVGDPPPGTRALLEQAVSLGTRSTEDLFRAQGGLAYDLPADRELAYVSRSAERLRGYWEQAQAGFAGEVRETLMTGLERGQAPADMAQALQQRTSVSRSRANLIVRNEVGTAQAAASEGDQIALGLSRYTWSTSRDSRVRPSHRVREGKTFDWDHPPPDGHPGEPILCRCVAIPVLD